MSDEPTDHPLLYDHDHYCPLCDRHYGCDSKSCRALSELECGACDVYRVPPPEPPSERAERLDELVREIWMMKVVLHDELGSAEKVILEREAQIERLRAEVERLRQELRKAETK